MPATITIERLETVEEYLSELTELLIRVVEDGASIGFLPPIDEAIAHQYWRSVIAPHVHLYVAKEEGRIAGSVQLHLVTKPNGLHRAEIAKLMTHPEFRRRGVARQLMQAAEDEARLEKRSLLVLDTREGDPSNLLYASIGYREAGRIPSYVISETGKYQATVLYYKQLTV